MKRCWKVSEQMLSQYVDQELSLEKREEIQTHIASCAPCSLHVTQLQEAKSQICALPALKPSEDFDFNFKTALLEVKRKERARVEPEKPHFIFVGIPRPVQVAAVALLSICLAIGGYSLFAPQGGTFLVASSGSVELRRTQEAGWQKVAGKIKLRSGDEVRTGVNSEAQIAARGIYGAKLLEQSEWVPLEIGTSQEHFALKRGTLMVKTEKNFKGKTMLVEGPSGKAEVVGTTFMVQALPYGKTTLSVSEGKVAFSDRQFQESVSTSVERFESSNVHDQGTPQLPRPIATENWKELATLDAMENPVVRKLLDIVSQPVRLTQQKLKEWQNSLLKESDVELASFGFYVLGEIQDEIMAPAEALEQYTSLLVHFPAAVESAWAFEFLRTKLDLVPSDADILGEEIDVQHFILPLKESTAATTAAFLKGKEPQRKFITTQFEISDKENIYVVERAMTFERHLGETRYSVVGYLDTIKEAKTNQSLLRVGKLFSRNADKRLSQVNTAVFHPQGRLIYTVDKKINYKGKEFLGYTETYQDVSQHLLARLERVVQHVSENGKLISYREVLKNAMGKILFSRNRSHIVYDKQGQIQDYEDELVDVRNRVAFERGRQVSQVAVGQEHLMNVDDKPFKTMDEVLKTLKQMRQRSSSFQPEIEKATPFSAR